MDSNPPTLPERYAAATLVARGGMGEVWRARDTQLDRDVAVKLLTPGHGPEPEATRRERLLREARAMARLSSHRNVATVYDVGEHEGRPWLAMEWLPGGTLADRIRSGPVDRDEAIRWLQQVAAALDAAHQAGVVHRDVKPGNVLFDASGDVRVVDFGIAKWSVATSATLTHPGSLVGTASYMSPEQARGEPVEAASDQYSLMLVAYELLTGRRPFARDSAVAELAAHVSDPPPPPSTHVPDLPWQVDRVFERGLAKDPAARHRSCTLAIEQLGHALAASADEPTVVLASAPRPGVDGRERARRLAPVVALVGVLVLLGIVLAALAQRESPADPAPQAARDAATTRAPAQDREEPATEAGDDERKQAAQADTAERKQAAQADAAERRRQAIERHERAFRLLQAGRYAEALELARSALADLSGVTPYEAYANYNVGASLIGLGRCAEALPYLDRSEQLQGRRSEIDAAREQARDCIEDADDDGKKKNGKGRGKGERHDD